MKQKYTLTTSDAVTVTVEYEYPSCSRQIMKKLYADAALIRNTLTILENCEDRKMSLSDDTTTSQVAQQWRQYLIGIRDSITRIRQRPIKTWATLDTGTRTITALAKCSNADLLANKCSKRAGKSAALRNLLHKCAEKRVLTPLLREKLFVQLKPLILIDGK